MVQNLNAVWSNHIAAIEKMTVSSCSTRSVQDPHTAVASVTAFFSACITYRVTY